MSKAHLQMTDLVSGVAAEEAVGRGAGHAAAEMMGLALAISTCTPPPMRNVSNEKHGARREGNLLSFGVQCGGECLKDHWHPWAVLRALFTSGSGRTEEVGPADHAVSWAQKFN